MLTNLVCVVGIFSFSCYAGLVIFARYYDCDPLASNVRHFLLPVSTNQLLNLKP